MPRSNADHHRGSSSERLPAGPNPLVGALVEVDVNNPNHSSSGSSASSSSHAGRRLRPRRPRSTDQQGSFDTSNESKLLQSRKQMIESLVRFSYHTPRAVLEDLIRHEMKLCRQQQEEVLQKEDGKEDGSVADGDSDEGSLSSLSSGEHPDRKLGGSFDMADLVMDDFRDAKAHILPDNKERESALVFIDISGFTRLSTMLDEESLSSVINSYFERIIGEINQHGGDILKFAGDALFVEWRVPKDKGDVDNWADSSNNSNVLKDLNSSLASMNTEEDLSETSGLALAVLKASRCAADIVRKYSDHDVTVPGRRLSGSIAVLNVHCGIGAGKMTGIHTSDYQEGDDENAVESRREYVFLGNAIDQVSQAAHIATDGEVLISPEALLFLAECCEVSSGMRDCPQPVCIASRGSTFVDFAGSTNAVPPNVTSPQMKDDEILAYRNIRRHCRRMRFASLSRLHSQAALYVHPVVRGEVWDSAVSGDMSAGAHLQQRHQMEAELRNVFTMFIKAVVSPNLTENPDHDEALFSKLRSIMHLTSRELDRFSGQLRQFIVDDKGVVLIAVFGLRGSTFSDLVANNALPACFAIQSALNTVGIDTRIGGTFGKAYCGVVGGLRRHEFAVMGAPVNLAARLMDSPLNQGVLVDENVRNQASGKFAFRSLQPIKAKGYEHPVIILEPVHSFSSRPTRKANAVKFVGREDEKTAIVGFAQAVLDDPSNPQASVVNIVGDSGIGKSALLVSAMNEIKLACVKRKKLLITLRSTSTEDQQRIPLCAFRKILLGAIRELCFRDGTVSAINQETIGAERGSNEVAAETPPRRPLHLTERRSSHAPRLQNVASPISLGKTKQSPDAREKRRKPAFTRQGSFAMHPDTRPGKVRGRFPYSEKLVWACKEAGYGEKYAHLIASQFLGLEDTSPDAQDDGAVPLMGDLVECIAKCFIKIVDFADIIVIFIDDFQWVDTLTWRVTRALSQSAKRMLFLRASRSHDKRAMRRLSNGLSRGVTSTMEITLGPLELDGIRELVSVILDMQNATDSIDEEVCTHIYQKTGGLPVYVIELLETVKRNNSYRWDNEGKLRLSLKETQGEEECSALVQGQMLNRFDILEASVRKVLQTCAVLGMSFSLSDVVRVHPDLSLLLVEEALNVGLSEMILAELGGEDDENKSTCSRSTTAGSHSKLGSSVGYSRTSSRLDLEGERNFEFSHEMWRSTVLATLLEARKSKLHRLIALAMEKELVGEALEKSDLSRLLTLFEHWKLCGDFSRAAPLALMVGERLNEWDLVNQSIDLYRDALDMSLQSVQPLETTQETQSGDWFQVSSNVGVLHLIIKLHVRIAQNYQLLNRTTKCIKAYEDAYTILRGCSKKCVSLQVTVLAGLTGVAFENIESSEEPILEKESLLEEFVDAAKEEGNSVHIGRALATRATFHAETGNFEKALEDFEALKGVYNAQDHTLRQRRLYGKDQVMDVFSQSTLWLFLVGKEEQAVEQGLFVLRHHLPLQDPSDVERIFFLLLPTILILKFNGRGEDAHFIFCKYVVNAYHDHVLSQKPCVELFNPLVYLLQIVQMEESEEYHVKLLEAIHGWVFDDNNTYYAPDQLRLGHTIMGEICYRLGQLRPMDDPKRSLLFEKAKSFLTPIARDVHSEPFLAHTALAFLRAMD